MDLSFESKDEPFGTSSNLNQGNEIAEAPCTSKVDATLMEL